MKGLCENCLDLTEVRGLEVGPDQGSQRDPWREKLQLCEFCSNCVVNHDLGALAKRHRDQRTHLVKSDDVRPSG